MELVVFPPMVRAGVGRIELRLRGHRLGDIDLMLCGVGQRGVIEHVRVDPAHRRLGYSRLLVAAARAGARFYVDDDQDPRDVRSGSVLGEGRLAGCRGSRSTAAICLKQPDFHHDNTAMVALPMSGEAVDH
jgi:hypothetical protein